MECKKCGGKLAVITTVHKSNKKTPYRYGYIKGDFTIRSLKCVSCGEKATSVELEESEILMLEKINKIKLAVADLIN